MGKNRFNLKEFFINLGLLIFSLIFVFGLAESACRFFYDENGLFEKAVINKIDIISRFADSQSYFDGKTGLVYDSTTRRINANWYAKFFQKKNINKEKEKGVCRIIVLGDSFSVGAGLENSYKNENIYHKLLEKSLNNKKGEFAPIKEFQVLSFADGALNTYQEYLILKDLAVEYQPDLVILQFTDNDTEPTRVPLGSDDYGQFIYSRTNVLLINNLPVPIWPFLNNHWGEFLLKKSALARFISYKTNIILNKNIISKKEVDLTLDSVIKINDLLKNKSVPLVAINFAPTQKSINHCQDEYEFGGKVLSEKLRRLAGEAGIVYFDICDYAENIYNLKTDLETADEGHYNEPGHRLAADILEKAVTNIIKKENH